MRTICTARATTTPRPAMELDPAYMDVAVADWEAFTGETAVLEDDGRSFAEMEAEWDADRNLSTTSSDPKLKLSPLICLKTRSQTISASAARRLRP